MALREHCFFEIQIIPWQKICSRKGCAGGVKLNFEFVNLSPHLKGPVAFGSIGTMSTTIEELSKATNSLKISRDLLKVAIETEPNNIELHKLIRDGSIQRFEFCIELSWKVSMKVLGLSVLAPNPAIRDMARNNLIDNPQLWFDFLTARNKTSHTYDEEIAKIVYAEVAKLIPALEQLILRLQKT